MQFLLTTLILILTIGLNSTLLFLASRTDGQLSRLRQIFTVHVLSITGWAIFILLIIWLPKLNQPSPYVAGDIGYLIEQIIFVFGVLLVSTNFWFAYYFTFRRVTLNALTGPVIVLQTITLVGSLIPNFFFSSVTITAQGYALLELSQYSGLYALFLLTHLVIPPAILIWGRNYAHNETHYKQSVLLAAIYAAFLLISITTNWILPVYFSIFTFNALGPTTSLIIVFGISYIILKHGFLDIRLVIQRGLIYTAILSVIVLIYAGVLAILSTVFDTNTVLSQYVSGVLAIIVSVLTVPRLDTFLRRVTNPIFFKDSYDYQTALLELTKTSHESLDMTALLSSSETKLAKVLQASSVHIVRNNTDHAAHDLEIPVRLKHEQVGVILVGPKKSGDPYSETDKTLLRTFARQTALAMGRVLLYQEVVERAKELENRVVERTSELHETQEKQRLMMLQISHNLQTPLAVLRAKLQNTHEHPELQKTATSLERSINELSMFVNDLLYYARLESGQDELTLQPTNISVLLQEITEEVTIIAEEVGVTVSSNIDSEVSALADQQRLREAFMNICSNALRYIGTGPKKKLAIKTTVDTKNIVITFTDTGVGIAEHEQEKIFDHFYQATNTTGGTGLGLSITRQIIEKHAGTITVMSEPGTGSIFTVTLPRHL